MTNREAVKVRVEKYRSNKNNFRTLVLQTKGQ